MPHLRQYLPILDWGRSYNRHSLSNDLIAAVIVTIMLIPQSLAYAMLAGLPPEAGIYASIVPIMLYAVFGTSRSLAVGPVAVVSLLTASAIGQVAEQGTAGYAVAALTLAGLSGAMLLAMGLLRLGFLANFLSHPVISGFITASGILIAVSQLKHILGIEAHGHTLPEILGALVSHLPDIHLPTVLIGVSATAFLFWVRKHLKSTLKRMGTPGVLADILKGWSGRGGGRDDVRGLGPQAVGSGCADRWRGAAKPAAAHSAQLCPGPCGGVDYAGYPDLGYWLCGKCVGRTDPCGQETATDRPGSRIDRLGRGQHRRGLYRGLSRHGGLCALGREL